MKKKFKALIRKSSLFLNLDLPYFIRGSFWLSSLQASGVFFGFLLSLVYANFLSKIIYGQYAYVFSFIALFGSLAHPGMQTAVVRATAQGREQILKLASQKTLPWAFLASLPLLGLAGYYYVKIPPDPNLAVTFFACFLLATPYWSFRFYDAFLVGKAKFRAYFWLSSLSHALTVVVIGGVVFFGAKIFWLVVLSLFLQTCLRFSFSKILSNRLSKKQATSADADLATSLNDVLIFQGLVGLADKIILAKILGFEAVAIYTFAQVMPEQLKTFLKNFSTLALPKLSRADLSNRLPLLRQKLVQYSLMGSALSVLYFILSPFIFRFFFPSYLDSVGLSRIVALSLIASPAFLAVSALFESQSQPRLLRQLIYPTYSLQLILLVVLTLWAQLPGTVWAVTLSRFFALGLSLFLLSRFFEQKLKGIQKETSK